MNSVNIDKIEFVRDGELFKLSLDKEVYDGKKAYWITGNHYNGKNCKTITNYQLEIEFAEYQPARVTFDSLSSCECEWIITVAEHDIDKDEHQVWLDTFK